MRRRLVPFLLMLCLCWQSLAYAGMAVLLAQGQERAHAQLHFEGQAHHHDDHGGAFHQDESPASTQHGLTDASVYAPVLPTVVTPPPLATGSASPPADAHVAEPPRLYLSGPERPPKTQS